MVEDQTVDFVYATSASAKMRRPLYIGLDDEIKTDSNGNEWHYFDPYDAAECLEITLNFSDGSSKSFGLDSMIHRSYSNYMLQLYFDDIEVNTAEAPLKSGSTYEVPFTYICNYRYPYVSSFEMTVEVEIAAASVTGISAEASHPIPAELFSTGEEVYAYLAQPKVAFTLSDGEKLFVDVNDQEYSHRLYGGRYFYFESDQSESNLWEVGGNYEFNVYFGDDRKFETKMPVTIEKYDGIKSISAVANEPVYEIAQGYKDDATGEYDYTLYDRDIDVKVDFNNGKALSFNYSDDDFHNTCIELKYDASVWKAGNSYSVDLVRYYRNEYDYFEPYVHGTFNVEFKANPIEEFTVTATAPAIYNDDGWTATDENGNEYYSYYEDRFHLFYTVEFNDGRPDMVNVSSYELGQLDFYVDAINQEEDHLELGKNKATATLGGKSCTYDVYIVEKYIKNISLISGITIIEGLFGNELYTCDPEYGEITYYEYLPQFFSAKVGVELYDGTVIVEDTQYNGDPKREIDASNRFPWSGDKLTQTEQDHWKVGDSFNLTLTVQTFQIYDNDEYVLTVPVTVVKNESAFKTSGAYKNPIFSSGLGLKINEVDRIPSDYKLVIPEEIYGYPVIEIESLYCFGYSHAMLEEVVLPDTVIKVNTMAFDSMRSMEYLYLGCVEEISQSCFNYASAYNVEFSKNNKKFSAADGVIYNKELTEIVAIARNGDVTIAPTVKEFNNKLLEHSEFMYADNTVTILGDDTRLIEIDNSTEYSEKTKFPFIVCRKGSAAEADAKALGIEYSTFSDIPLDDESTEMPVTVTAFDDAELPEDARLSVKLLDASDEKQIVYDITIMSGNEAVQPKAPVTVAIDVPAGMNIDRVKVYRLEEDGSKTNMKATLKDGKLVFTTDHFSLYSVEEVFYTPGDINDDDVISLVDVTTLAQVVADWDVAHNENATDVNGDGETSLLDVVHLAQYNAEWNGIVLH